VVSKVVEDKRLNDLVKKLESKADVFDGLRCAMRIALPEGKNGINDSGDSTGMKSIEKKVTAFRKWLLAISTARKPMPRWLCRLINTGKNFLLIQYRLSPQMG
jgi:hypothetical protein